VILTKYHARQYGPYLDGATRRRMAQRRKLSIQFRKNVGLLDDQEIDVCPEALIFRRAFRTDSTRATCPTTATLYVFTGGTIW